MPNTTNRSYPYPSSSAAPDGPTQFQALATAIDTDVQTLYTRGWTTVIKANATSRQSTTTPAVDSGTGTVLSGIALAAGSYHIEVGLFFTSADATAKFRSQWSFSGTYGTPLRFCFGPGNTNSAGPTVVTPVSLAAVGTTTSIDYATNTGGSFYAAIEKAHAIVSVAGNFGVSWSQASSVAANTTLQASSYVRIHRYA